MSEQPRVVYVPVPTVNAFAIAALTLGLIAQGLAVLIAAFGPTPSVVVVVLFAWLPTLVPAILAIVFGFIGIAVANRNGGLRYRSAFWGIVFGFTPMVTWLFGVLIRAVLFGASAGWRFG